MTAEELREQSRRLNAMVRESDSKRFDSLLSFHNWLLEYEHDEGDAELFFRFVGPKDGVISLEIYKDGTLWDSLDLKNECNPFLRLRRVLEGVCVDSEGEDNENNEPIYCPYFLNIGDGCFILSKKDGQRLECSCDMKDTVENLYLAGLEFLGLFCRQKDFAREWFNREERDDYAHFELYNQFKSDIVEAALYSGKEEIEFPDRNMPSIKETYRLDFDYGCVFWDHEGAGAGDWDLLSADIGDIDFSSSTEMKEWSDACWNKLDMICSNPKYIREDSLPDIIPLQEKAALSARALLPKSFDLFCFAKFPIKEICGEYGFKMSVSRLVPRNQ